MWYTLLGLLAVGSSQLIAGGGGGDTLPATQASVQVTTCTLSPGTFWIGSRPQAVLRALNTGTNVITRKAGTYRPGRAEELPNSDPLTTSLGDMQLISAAPDGTVYIGYPQKIRRYKNGALDDFITTNLTSPAGSAASNRFLYVVDYGRLKVFDRNTGQLVRELSGFNSPIGVAVSPDDALVYVLENTYVKRVSPDNTITTIAGGGSDRGDSVPANHATFGTPKSIALATDGSLYVTDYTAHRVVQIKDGMATRVFGVTMVGQVGTAWITTHDALTQPITNPDCVAVNDTTLFVCSTKDQLCYTAARAPVVLATPTAVMPTTIPTTLPTRTATPLPTPTCPPNCPAR